jgi:ABC-type polysaccharide/polyol phosphate export permease
MMFSSNRLRRAFSLSWLELKSRYRRSALGPLWSVITTLVGVAGLGVVWSKLMNQPQEQFVPTLASGLIVWQLIAGIVTEAPSSLIRGASVIKSTQIDPSFFCLVNYARNCINFIHNLLVLVIVFMLFPQSFSLTTLLAVPGFILSSIILYHFSVLVAYAGSRFRDLDPLITSIWPIIFLLSPVIYRPSDIPGAGELMYLNPLSYLISLIRDPIQGITPDNFTYAVSIIAGLVLAVISGLLRKRVGRRVVYSL